MGTIPKGLEQQLRGSRYSTESIIRARGGNSRSAAVTGWEQKVIDQTSSELC